VSRVFPLRILTGPTAAGKTSLAIEWAERTGGWILSCDALLFYRGADIGTAKPTAAERQRAPHFGIDLSPSHRVFSLPEYIDHAKQVLAEADEAGVPVLVVGGSGFYAAAFHDPAPDPISIDSVVKETVRAISESGGAEALGARLLQVDPEAGAEVDLSNPRRTAPALERCLATGLSTAALRRRREETPCAFADREREWYLIDPGDEILAPRIESRTALMVDQGLVDEVFHLRKAGFEANPTLARAIGYRETLSMIDGNLPEKDLIDGINHHTTRLVRRQRKWLRNRLPPFRPGNELLSQR